MIDREDEARLIERMKDVFVTRAECDSKVEEINDKLSNDSTELALIKQDVGTIKWVSKTILGTVIAAIVAAIMALILR